jgi:hypothetical protein
MANTFVESERLAVVSLNQADKQLTTAINLVGEQAAAVATNQVTRATALFGQVNTFLGLSSDSVTRANAQITNMAQTAIDNIQRQSVQELTTRSRNISVTIERTRAESLALMARLNSQQANDAVLQRTPAVNSAGEEVIENQNARADDSLVQNPQLPGQVLNPDGSRGRPLATLAQSSNATQPALINNANLGLVDGANTEGGAVPTRTINQTNGTTVAPGDDNYPTNQSDQLDGAPLDGNRPVIAPEFLSKIVPTANPLSRLASMTYTVSIYLMNMEEYARLFVSRNKVLPTQQLLIQSGGISQGVGSNSSATTNQNIGQRNPYFDLDFYIDDLTINSIVGTQGGSRSHNAVNLEFTVIEPNGITFIERLRRAAKEHLRTAGPTASEATANYLMIIRFYGYDAQGNLVNSSQLGTKEVGSDTNAIIEKWYPFQIQNIRYRIQAHNVEYRITASTPSTNIAFSNMYATIPFDFELAAPDVQTLLNGKAVSRSAAAPTNTQVDPNQSPEETARLNRQAGNTAPPAASQLSQQKIFTQGLCEALNQHQRELVAKGEQEVADEYEIILEDVSGLVDAKMARPGRNAKSRAAMTIGQNAAEKLLPGKTRYDKNTKRWSVTRGTQISQLIDLVLRNSSYIYSQQNIVFDEKTLKPRAQDPVKTVQWFKIKSQVTPLQNLKYDNKRNTFGYKVTYIVSRYQINDPRIPVFPNAVYRGTHKLYNWMFTGQNSEIVDFDIEANYNYVTVFGNDQNVVGTEQNPSSGRIAEKRFYQNKPNAESTGGPGDVNSSAANLSERLYSDADIQKSVLTIVGDPDWMIQNDAFYQGIDLNPFMLDGSVNYDASQVLYEVRFNPVSDYDGRTGKVEFNQFNVPVSPITGETNIPQQSAVYAAQTVVNSFNKGRFTQRLTGTIQGFYPETANLTELENAKISGSGRPISPPEPVSATIPKNTIASIRATRTLPDSPISRILDSNLDSLLTASISQLTISATTPKLGSSTVNDDAVEPVNTPGP